MAVWSAKTKLPQSPRFVFWFRCDERTPSGYLSVKLIHTLDVPIRDVRMVSQFACRFLVGALPEHHSEIVPGEKAPSLGVNRILAEA